VTGDLEIDLMAGILAVLNADPHDHIRGSINIRVLQYVLDREKAIERDAERKADEWRRTQQLGAIGQGLGAAPPGSIAYPQQVPPHWTTSSGTPPNLLDDQDWHAKYEAYKASQTANAAAQQIHDYNSLQSKTASEQTRYLNGQKIYPGEVGPF
jgi:hypothetical protein